MHRTFIGVQSTRFSTLCTGLFQKFRTGDVVIIRSVLRPDQTALSDPLEPDASWHTKQFGTFLHNDFLDKDTRTTIVNDNGDKYIVTHPTLEDYLINRRRQATPIYPFDASAIVALADIHVDGTVDMSQDGETLHFLEAGSGHGSLTLAICKAIHAANPSGGRKGALLHSIDRNQTQSRIAEKNVMHFRRGLYSRDVDFHVGDSPEAWLAANAKTLKLSAVFLDLPSPRSSIDAISRQMIVDAPLLIFCPSISQIQELAELVQNNREILLSLVNVVELMPGMGGSMRAWDVRTTTIKETGETAKVCRPRVGTRVVGGGFVCIFRRLPEGSRLSNKPTKVETQVETEPSWISKWTNKLLHLIG